MSDARRELWGWCARSPDAGWTLIAAIVVPLTHLGPVVLIHRDKDVVEGMRKYAEAHHKSTGQEITLVRYTGTYQGEVEYE